MFRTMTLKPAYNRVYKTEEEALNDWNNGLDFYSITHSAYCSNRDMRYYIQDGIIGINIYLDSTLNTYTSIELDY